MHLSILHFSRGCIFFFFFLSFLVYSFKMPQRGCTTLKMFFKWHHGHHIFVHTSPSVSVWEADRNRDRQSRQRTTLSANIDPQTVKHMSYYSYALLFSLLPLTSLSLLLSRLLQTAADGFILQATWFTSLSGRAHVLAPLMLSEQCLRCHIHWIPMGNFS